MEPNYRVHLAAGDSFDASRDLTRMAAEVDRIEAGAGARIPAFLEDAAYKYRVAREKFVGRNFLHPF
jgi:phytoene desaturase